MAPISNAVFATLLMNDGYLPGAMVLGHSLRDRKAHGRLVAFVVIERLSDSTISELKTVYDEVVPIRQITNQQPANLYLMDRPDLISTFTKIELWKQTQYSRIVYIDADVVAVRAPNELLTMDTSFAAAPDIGWPDCFNSGVMVLNPNMADYYALLALAERGISFDGADQGLLNMHFADWDRLSFTYNCTPSGNYQYTPAYRHFQSSINLIHFIGKQKPWHLGRQSSKQGGVYGELLGRWWAVYDRHYRAQETIYYSGSWQTAPKRVQDYVLGEETIYLPAYQSPAQPNGPTTQQPSASVLSVVVHAPANAPQAASAEQPLGDQPAVEEQVQTGAYVPTPTQEQRKWSAPQVEWEPARAPPPTNSKPEASNFPSMVYEMSESKELFKPPTSYPEAPKGMWYEVPEKVAPPPKPKPIFPWEMNAPKPTRIFAEPKLASPPPEPAPMAENQTTTLPESASGMESEVDRSVDSSTAASSVTDATTGTTDTAETVETPKASFVDTWSTFNQRTNAWDDMPEISQYMQAFTQSRKAKIQVLHHTPSTPAATGDDGLTSPTSSDLRRGSVKITDFPTEIERPSLPVTPAPIRRPSFWGGDADGTGELPIAAGVPKQEEWVRRFSSYPTPHFDTLPPLVHEIDGVFFLECQHCGKQNPISQLDELQRRESAGGLLHRNAMTVRDPPRRAMPESISKEAMVAATERAMSSATVTPLKPILKEPSFEVPATRREATVTEAGRGNLSYDDELDPTSDLLLEANLSPTQTV